MNPYEPPDDDLPRPKRTFRFWWGVLAAVVFVLLLVVWCIQAWYMLVPQFGIDDVEFGPVP